MDGSRKQMQKLYIVYRDSSVAIYIRFIQIIIPLALAIKHRRFRMSNNDRWLYCESCKC